MINISKEEIRNKMFFVRAEDSDQPIAVIKVGDLLEKEVNAVNCSDCDGYEAGYSAGLKDAKRGSE